MTDSTSVNINSSSQEVGKIPEAPIGWRRLLWLGPSFLWMLSAAGSGEVLFTPRIAALYGYSLLWALLAAVMLKWFINREIGRYTVCTGRTFINGCHDLPGPTNWAIWLILVPQAAVAVATIAGMAGAAADAMYVLTSGSKKTITILIIAITGLVVLFGRYRVVDMLASVCGIVLSLAVIIAATSILPDGQKMINGLIPTLPATTKYEEVLPWLGFMLAGAAGLMWFSNWVLARGYGAAMDEDEDKFDISSASARDKKRLQGWLRQMSISNTLAVIGALLIAIAFLILGSELLQPKGLVPQEDKMSEVLGKLLGELWGPFGFWFMISAVFISFWTTVLTNQDGWGRMFSSATKMLLRQFNVKGKWTRVGSLRKIYIAVLLIISPCALYLLMGKPVSLLMVAGSIEAAHIPVVACLVLYLNKTKLPQELTPSPLSFWATAMAALFFAFFAVFYILQITT